MSSNPIRGVVREFYKANKANGLGIICPSMVEIGLTYLKNFGKAAALLSYH